MLKNCDDCGTQFNIFQGGFGNQFFTVCGKCWEAELKRREIGGVFTRTENPVSENYEEYGYGTFPAH